MRKTSELNYNRTLGRDAPDRGAAGRTKSEDFEVKTLSPLSASGNKKGDKFTVQVLTPEKYRDALIEGEVANSKASGKVKGKSELLFRFNKLTAADKTEIPIRADLTEIRNSKGVANVDEEGQSYRKVFQNERRHNGWRARRHRSGDRWSYFRRRGGRHRRRDRRRRCLDNCVQHHG